MSASFQSSTNESRSLSFVAIPPASGLEAVLAAVMRAVEGLRRLEELEAAVSGHLAHALHERRALRRGQRLESPRQRDVLAQLLQAGHADDLRRDGLAERVAVGLGGA